MRCASAKLSCPTVAVNATWGVHVDMYWQIIFDLTYIAVSLLHKAWHLGKEMIQNTAFVTTTCKITTTILKLFIFKYKFRVNHLLQVHLSSSPKVWSHCYNTCVHRQLKEWHVRGMGVKAWVVGDGQNACSSPVPLSRNMGFSSYLRTPLLFHLIPSYHAFPNTLCCSRTWLQMTTVSCLRESHSTLRGFSEKCFCSINGGHHKMIYTL
jgi:hypothetical protein